MHGSSDIKSRMRKLLTWNMLLSGKANVGSMMVGGPVIYVYLTLSSYYYVEHPSSLYLTTRTQLVLPEKG